MGETYDPGRTPLDRGIKDDLRQMGVVTKYELLKHMRSRRMLVFAGIAALMFILITVLSLALDGKLPDEPTEFMKTYLSMMDLVIIIGVSLFCASTIAAEFEERTALLMFPRPIKKTSFFMGKVMACYILCGGVITLYYGLCAILSLIAAGGLDMNMFGSLGMAMMFMFGAGGFALLMSSIFKRGSIAVIVTIAMLLLVLGGIVDALMGVFDVEPVFSITYAAKDILNFIVGDVTMGFSIDLSTFGGTGDFTYKVFYPSHWMAFSIAVIWGVVTTTLSALLFRKKEF